MKKILFLVLALALVMSLGIPAFAAEINGDNSKDVTANYQAGEASQKVYLVDIVWGSLEFTYTDASEGTWDPETHTYTGTAENLHGNVTVNFTVEGGKLTKIEVVSGELFITADQLAAYLTSIVDAQDPTVDMVSGATVDCQAITSAMTAAFAD